MTKPRTMSVNIPFEGFYESRYSGEVDHTQTQEAEYFEEYRQTEEGVPEELQLTKDEYESILYNHADYGAAYRDIARAYVDAFGEECEESLGFNPRFAFEHMTSPREYNFETDRLFCDVPVSVIARMFALSKADDHNTLLKTILGRHTSCSGFISYYRNTLDSWLNRGEECKAHGWPVSQPWRTWDHNELGTLLRAVLELKEADNTSGEEFDWRVYSRLTDTGETVHNAWSNCVDWDKVESAVKDKREEMAQEMRDRMGITTPPESQWAARCDKTLDLFPESK